MSIKFDSRNYRQHNDRNKALIKKSLDECGAGRSIVVDNENKIIAGNGVYEQAQALNMPVKVIETDGSELVVVKRTDLTPDDERRRQLAIMDNSTSDSSEFDFELLTEDFDLDDLSNFGIDLELPKLDKYSDGINGSLCSNFLIPPFSILSAQSGEWQNRKKAWLDLGIKSEIGRKKFYDPLKTLQEKKSENNNSRNSWADTSIFDPVLCEIAYSWFSKEGDCIIDPFAGGSVRGIVASVLKRSYTGIDLRCEQIQANNKNAEEIGINNLPIWLVGDSNKVLDTLPDETFDMCLSCPPYADLEVYSDDADDLSNMEYGQFIKVYSGIIRKLYDKLKDNSFVVWVVGEVRNKKGDYYNFIGDTIKAFLDAGFNYYNELILQTMLGTAMLRASKQFQASRKVIKVHQNILVFVKGDGKKSSKRLGNVQIKEEISEEWIGHP